MNFSGQKSGPVATFTFTPEIADRGRVTALCSNPEMSTVIPDLTSVLMAKFKP